MSNARPVGGRIPSWVPLRPTALVLPPARRLPFPLEDPGARLYEWGRHGLWHGIRMLGLAAGDEVLVPAYHHGSEVGTLDAAGLRQRFYEATEKLEPDPDELEGLIGPRTRALYLIHYLGFPSDAPRWRRWCDERGLLLIEDVAMAWLAELEGRPLGSWGDIAFYSPWKTYGLPDCGALLCEPAPAQPRRRRRTPTRELALSGAKWFGQRSSLLTRVRPRGRGEEGFDSEREFGVGDPDLAPSAVTMFLVRRLCRRDAAASRRQNYRRLLSELGHLVPRPFDSPGEGACPFFFPIATEDKPGLLRYLSEREISPLDMWSFAHPLLPSERFPAAARRRATTLGLPVHQELRERDLERIVAAVLEYPTSWPAERRKAMQEGRPAPDFELLDQDGKPVRLSQFAGQNVVLYFYPEADTPGCTKQACGIRDRHTELTDLNAVVLGVSPDGPERLRRFADNHGLPFTLLSDADHEVARQYDVWVRRPGLLPRKENERTTFLVGPDGTIKRVFRSVDPVVHDRLVAEALSA